MRRDGPEWTRWEHPDWTGRTVFVLGGGPSLRGFNPLRLGEHPIVAINEAGLSLCRYADILFWSDVRWIDWNFDRLSLHTGPMRYTCQRSGIDEIPYARLIEFRPWLDGRVPNALELDPRAVGGQDSGTKAVNLIYHTRAARVVLLGFDMHDLPPDRWQEGNWHAAHKAPPLVGQRAEFAKAHARMAAALDSAPHRMEVVNATPGSALTCWPVVELDSLL